jgi:hypothetical protein
MGRILGPLAGRMAGPIAKALGSKFPNAMGVIVGEAVGKFLADNGMTIVSVLFGGPMGMDVGTFGGLATDQEGNAWTPGGALGGAASGYGEAGGRALGELFDPPEDRKGFEAPTISKPVAAPKPQIPNVTNNPPPL